MFLLSLAEYWYPLIFLGTLGSIFLCFLPFILSATRMTKAFSRLKIGMTYDEVIAAMGEPKREHSMADNIVVSTWTRHPIRGVYIVRTAYFKNGILASVSEDSTL